MGRKALPDEVKAMRGTLKKCRAGKKAPGAEVAGVCRPVTKAAAPAWLSPDARKLFDKTAKMLISWRVLTKLDISLLAAYAAAYENFMKAYEVLRNGAGFFYEVETKSGTTFTMHPAAKMFKDSLDVINKVGAQFGLSPVSRRAIESASAQERADVNKETDPFDQYFDNK